MFTDRKLLSVVKVSVILNLISRFSAIPAEISYSVHTDKLILKFIWRDRRSTAANTTLGKNNAVSGSTLPGFRAYCEATVIKAAADWRENGQAGQQNRNRAQKQTHVRMVNRSVTEEQKQCNGAKTIFSRNSAETRQPHAKKTQKTGHRPYTLHMHRNSLKKFITDLNVKAESVNKTQKDIYMTLGIARTF